MDKKIVLPVVILLALVITSLVFAWQGVSMHQQVAVEEEQFHELQEDYFMLAKSERDSAPEGSELNEMLVDIKNYPSFLLELKLVGVGKILTGIFGVLLAIVFLLFMMPVRLAKLMKEEE